MRSRPLLYDSLRYFGVWFGLLFALISVGSLGCAGPRASARHISIARGVEFDLLDPGTFGESISLEQTVAARHGEHVSSFHCLFEVDERKLVLVALTPFGTRAFVLTLEDGELRVENSVEQPLPAEPSRVLADLQLVLWKTLPPVHGLEMVEHDAPDGGFVREFRRSALGQVDGPPVIRVTYASAIRWQGRVLFQHLEQGYELEITTLRSETLAP